MAVKGQTKYKKEYCEEIIKFMGDGYTVKAFAGHVGVCRNTIYDWFKLYPEFAAAKSRGEAACEKYLIRMGKLLASGKLKGNATPWVFMCKNMLGWTDRADLRVSNPAEENKEDTELLRDVPRAELLRLVRK